MTVQIETHITDFGGFFQPQPDRPYFFRASAQKPGKQNFTSASCCTPLVWLVVAYPSILASPSCPTSTQRLGLRHSSCLHLSPHPSRLVGCRIAQHLNPHLVATSPGALASASCCSLARDCIPGHLPQLPPLPPPYPSCMMSPSLDREWGLPKHHHWLLSRWASVASAGPPLLLPSLHASVASVGSPLTLPLPCTSVARAWPRGGSEYKWMMFLFQEHQK